MKEAKSSDEWQNWKQAMDEEHQSLMENDTWELTQLPPDRKAINNKWVFRTKTDANGNITRYKARLVAKGCSQRAGIDYKETFSPVVRYSSIRLLMSLAVEFDLKIEQMDAVTAFLQGDIDEVIYMRQPEQFDDFTGRVCSLYGLKQASRQWNIKLSRALIACNYKQCETDSCIYIRRQKQSIVIVSVYVDDLLIFWNTASWRNDLKDKLMSQFKMKDLGQVSNILGIRIERNSREEKITFDQRNYIENILRRFNMDDCNPVKTPIDINQRLSDEMSPKTQKELDDMQFVQGVSFRVSTILQK